MSTVANIITAVGYRIGISIDASSEPSSTECIQWLNEDVKWILALCAEEGSDIGQTEGSITTVDGTASYADFATTMYAPEEYGWIEAASTRTKIHLTSAKAKIGFTPGAANEGQPERFYVDGSNSVYFLPTPDQAYTIKIPYWQIQTTLTATSDTVPFNGLFDPVLTENLSIRIQNRDEYDVQFEQSWMNFLSERVRNLIRMRVNSRNRIQITRSERFVGENVRNEKATAQA